VACSSLYSAGTVTTKLHIAGPKMLAWLGLCLCALLAGCRSPGKPTAGPGIAMVEIHGSSPSEISARAEDVFRQNGYQLVHSGPNDLLFEREGSRMETFTYGSWLDPLWIRVKAYIVPSAAATLRLECKAWMVTDKGGVTEDEVPVTHLHPYQKLLDEVARRCNLAASHPSDGSPTTNQIQGR